jgi:hypothetical protein
MPTLVWDKFEDRVYQSGLDRGVLYLPDGSAVPWNGLVEVIENYNNESEPVYYDGRKINDLVSLGDFSASMKALTYPEEFVELEGFASMRQGLLVGDQRPKAFGLAWRTKVGSAIDEDEGYKIHLLYNVTAIPQEKTHTTISNDPSMEEFEWAIFAVPEEIPGFAPTAHFILDSREVDPWLLEEIEGKLYGSVSLSAFLIPMAQLVSFINEWYRVKIVDNGDGTWTATSQREGFISFLDRDETEFQIQHINAVYLDEDTYRLSDTLDVKDVPQIKIDDNGDGTWTATTTTDDLLVMLDPNTFELRNANVSYISDYAYKLSDTTDEN